MVVRGSDLPFKAGQEVESRSFQEGFRGAWFRSKISSIHRRQDGHFAYSLKYLDFPDEKKSWTKVYQKPRAYNKMLKQKNQHVLMVRPRFPPVYCECQMPDVNTISKPVVIVNDDWKVGDLIDWWKDECYWSGSITKILKDEKFQIVLLPPPLGEGIPYEASGKDMRPSLDWSLEHGWTVPTPKDSDHGCCARIIQPAKKGKNRSSTSRGRGDKGGESQDIAGGSQSSFASHSSPTSLRPPDKKSKGTKKRALGFKATGAEDVATSVGKKRLGKYEEGKSDSHGVVVALESPITSPTSLDSLSEPRNNGKGVVKLPLGIKKRPRPETSWDSGKGNGVTKKTRVSDSDSSPHSQARSTQRGDKNGVAKVTLDDGKEKDVRARTTSLELSPQTQPPAKLGTTEKNPLGTLAKGFDMDSGLENACTKKTGSPESNPVEIGETGEGKETTDHSGPRKKTELHEIVIPRNSMFSDTVESSVVDLVELLHLIKWMKGLLDNGNTRRPPFKFLEHRSSSTRR